MPRTRATRQQPRPPTGTPAAPSRRTFQVLFVFVGSVLIANAIVGDRGLIATRAARRDSERLASHITMLRSENARPRKDSHRLRTDAAAIEAVARDEFGLLRPGEIVFLLADGPGVREAR